MELPRSAVFHSLQCLSILSARQSASVNTSGVWLLVSMSKGLCQDYFAISFLHLVGFHICVHMFYITVHFFEPLGCLLFLPSRGFAALSLASHVLRRYQRRYQCLPVK